MKMRIKPAISGAVVGQAVLRFTARPSFGQLPTQEPNTLPHEEMHSTIETVQCTGTSQRMHETMGADAEKLMDQCVSMGMMGGQNEQSMQHLIREMMGREMISYANSMVTYSGRRIIAPVGEISLMQELTVLRKGAFVPDSMKRIIGTERFHELEKKTMSCCGGRNTRVTARWHVTFQVRQSRRR